MDPIHAELVYGRSAATLSGCQDAPAHGFLLGGGGAGAGATRAWASPAPPTRGCDGEWGVGALGHPFPSVKWARDGSEPHGAGVSPTGWLWGNPKPQAWGWLYVFEPENGVISGEETSALPKALSHGSFVFLSTYARLVGDCPLRKLSLLLIRLTPLLCLRRRRERSRQTGQDMSSRTRWPFPAHQDLGAPSPKTLYCYRMNLHPAGVCILDLT